MRVHQQYIAHSRVYALLCGQFVSWLSTAWVRQLKQTSFCSPIAYSFNLNALVYYKNTSSGNTRTVVSS